MNDTDDNMRDDIRGRVDALVALGRPAEARATARGALDADGPDAGLLLALAHAHMAEDDDDHDDAAEQVFREGLDAFPDDIGLLAGYAELCARTDALDRPGRHARGPVLLARLRELAPDSPELRRSETAGSSVPTNAKDSVSARRTQSFDAARSFAEAPTPRAAAVQAAQWAAAAPRVLRLAVLAETTDALAAPGRTWSRVLLRRGLEYRFAVGVVTAVLIVLRLTVLPTVPYGVATGVGLLLGLPFLGLRKQLRAARQRAAERMAAAVTEAVPGDEAGAGGAEVGPPELPPVPRVAPREYAFAGAGLALLLTVGVTAYVSSLAYPRYDIVAHDTFRGLKGFDLREEFDPFGAVPDSELEESAARVYVAEDAAADDAAEYLVAVTTGDFHEMRESYVYDGGAVPVETEGIGIVHDTWGAGAGPYGGWMRCLRYTEVTTGTLRAMCVWADKGSMGMVLFTAADKNHDAVEETARSVGADFLRPARD
ncbi:hypothetical protein [Streptomyces sp. TLI_105]|uniref:hypothetical protein n=1 Tax=Streptomyces sp. TLI_105 TaxID=1881019 RepID=UPI00089932EE|nr:hypothetical protein [Streptomyces sp. TLI_105]SEB63370.1 hypothetical protein SAMN05428939_0267 [Streptomyces sp. TLI_105]